MASYPSEARRPDARVIAIWFILILVVRPGSAADSICERIDFNDINTWKVQQCSGAFRESFRLSSYASSQTFRPFRDRTTYFLSNDVRGISCTESINSFYMNSFTEIRMIYQLMFYNPCSLTLMVYDLDLMDVFGQPLLAQNWTTRAQTSTWSLFVGKVEREIRRARILLQADMSADGQLAIEYITVFNPLVLEEFCMVLDEFYTTTELTTVTTRPTTSIPYTTTRRTTTTTTRPTTTTTTTPTTTTTTTTRPTTTTTTTPTTTTTTTTRPTTTTTTTPTTTTTTTTTPATTTTTTPTTTTTTTTTTTPTTTTTTTPTTTTTTTTSTTTTPTTTTTTPTTTTTTPTTTTTSTTTTTTPMTTSTTTTTTPTTITATTTPSTTATTEMPSTPPLSLPSTSIPISTESTLPYTLTSMEYSSETISDYTASASTDGSSTTTTSTPFSSTTMIYTTTRRRRTTTNTLEVTTARTSIESTTSTTTPAISTHSTETYPVTITSVVTTTADRTTPSTVAATTRDLSSTVFSTNTPSAPSTTSAESSLPVSNFPNSTPATTTTITTEYPASLPTTLPVSTAANESIALWIALSGIFIVLFTLASAYALYVYVAGIEINRALGGIGSFLTCRRSSRSKRSNEHDAATANGPNNFDPNDTFYHQQIQQQLKNRLRPMHNSVSSISNNSSKAIRQKYPRVSMDSYQRGVIGAGKALPFGQPRLELMDDIDIIKYKNRLNQL